MSSTPQSPRTTSPLLSSRACDAAVAPYLTHIVTHHGQITLLPPQNQGRVRTNKKVRSKVPQAEPQRHDVLPLTSHSVSSLGGTSTLPSGRKQKSRRNIIRTSTNAEDPGPSRIGLGSETTPNSLLPPPPSYESIRRETPRTSSNDVIALSSSSSDDFEDIAGVDLESQWELDRMSGFTLEERVRREWFRRQAVMERTTLAVTATSTPDPELHTRPIDGEFQFDFPEPPSPPPKDYNTGETEVFSTISTSSERVNRGEAFQRNIGRRPPYICNASSSSSAKTISSRSSIGDWALLEPLLSESCSESSPLVQSSSSGNPNVARHQPGHSARASYHEPSSSAGVSSAVTHFAVSGASRGSSESLASTTARTISFHSPTQPEDMIAIHGDVNLSGPSSGELALFPRTTLESKERESDDPVTSHSPNSNGSLRLAVHRRPLPDPPVPQVSPESTVSTTQSTTPIPQISGQVPPSAFLPDDNRPADPPPLAPAPGTSNSVRDRVAKFESMRDRPVPPPPADFLARSRVKRKPPPVPPSSYRHRMSDSERGAPNLRARPLDERVMNEPLTGTKAESSAFSQRIPRLNSEYLPSSPDVRHALTAQRLSGIEHRTSLFRPSTPDSTESHGNGLAPYHPDLPSEPAAGEELTRDGGPPTPGLHSDSVESAIESASGGRTVETSALPLSPDVLDPPPDASGSDGIESLSVEVVPSRPPSTRPPDAGTTLGPYTDLDVLLSRLDDASSGNRYDDLLIVSDLLGPAQPQQASPSQIVADLPLGRIEVLRRRKLQDGRVKLKLSLLGVMVDRCGACLSQFKDAELAILLPCLHPFHSTCLQSWLARSRTCPLCRVTLDVPA